ncbi:acyltransferase-domain-containing protein [Piedraia hortae CBS 480.64]|uniref:Acyltransferase-domain-containing protein n=1 Tax=Piedraia hortae CBS 480.64 TaxID=1314780 RepID=A0A6A7BSF8_9PEZI|nr:acyltransferase-domain-containing protein [Piedraia hortae CBS 480.64]
MMTESRLPPNDKGHHSLGEAQHGVLVSSLRALLFTVHFFGIGLFLHGSQYMGASLYLWSRRRYYAWMAMTKEHFGLLITSMTQTWSPTTLRISGDASMAGLMEKQADGMLRLRLGERIVLMANHQIYTDWLYLWWICYANAPPMHGHIYIILKESLKCIPIFGPAMMFFGFIFMARKWQTDEGRMRYRLKKLSSIPLRPMWLLIFPEGTNLSANTRRGSKKYSEKMEISDMKYQLLPRSTGLRFCLSELHDTVEYLYDCTTAYEGIPPGGYGQDIFTLKSVCFQGRPPKAVHMYWRRFKIADMPLDDRDAMADWTLQRWREKDELLEAFNTTGSFPSDPVAVGNEKGYLEVQIRLRKWWEILQLMVPAFTAAALGSVCVRLVDWFTT